MNTLLATNTLLIIIVACIAFVTLLWGIALFYLIGIVRHVRRLVKEFDDDVYRTRSVLIAIKDLVVEKIFGKAKK